MPAQYVAATKQEVHGDVGSVPAPDEVELSELEQPNIVTTIKRYKKL
jgi:hypothetical protein